MSSLFEQGVLQKSESGAAGVVPVVVQTAGLMFEQQKELLAMQFEQEKLQLELRLEQEKLQFEQEKLELRLEQEKLQFEQENLQLELRLEQEKLQFEQEKLQLELRLEQEKLQFEKEKLQLELRLEQEKLQFEKEKLQLELRLRQQEVEKRLEVEKVEKKLEVENARLRLIGEGKLSSDGSASAVVRGSKGCHSVWPLMAVLQRIVLGVIGDVEKMVAIPAVVQSFHQAPPVDLQVRGDPRAPEWVYPQGVGSGMVPDKKLVCADLDVGSGFEPFITEDVVSVVTRVPPPVVVSRPLASGEPDESGLQFPSVFQVCAVTRAQSRRMSADPPVSECRKSGVEQVVSLPDLPSSVSKEEEDEETLPQS
ncbi:hypothetical protein NQZ68_039245 [Dissostichus eleginoides]|nr:hypothetical protein NQZ68_039245 [Dissostichus eleginoides]